VKELKRKERKSDTSRGERRSQKKS